MSQQILCLLMSFVEDFFNGLDGFYDPGARFPEVNVSCLADDFCLFLVLSIRIVFRVAQRSPGGESAECLPYPAGCCPDTMA